ncbi:MAG: Crp/Fnr family transcriptional regulator [Bacillota bacterium]
MSTANGFSQRLTQLLNNPDYYQEFRAGDYVFHEADLATELYIIQSGKVEVGKTSPDGKELSLRLCSTGDVIGELNIGLESNFFLLHAKALEYTKAAVFTTSRLKTELQKDGKLAIDFINLMNNALRRDQTKFRDLVMFGKRGALYSTLIRLSNSYGLKQEQAIFINIALTNQELANFCGTTRESVSRLLNELKREGILTIYKGYITIHNLQYLKNAINCDECPVHLCTIH